MKNEPERKRKSDKGTESQKKQQKISEKSGSKKAAQHDFYHGDCCLFLRWFFFLCQN